MSSRNRATMSSAWSDACASKGKACTGWVEKYLSDCLCSTRDDVSFALGLVSLGFWGVAEVPQLVTNFRNKSGHGVSLALLLTWVVGDIFNLVGCLLEPATLPTQLYTAWLYTAITVVLLLQTLYYDYLPKHWGKRKGRQQHSFPEPQHGQKMADSDDDGKSSSTGSTIPIPTTNIIRRDTYYTSARSLASSGTPPFRSPSSSCSSYLRPPPTTIGAVVKSGPAAVEAPLLRDRSSSDEDEPEEGRPRLPHTDVPSRGPRHGRCWTERVGAISRSVGYGTFLSTAITFPAQTNGVNVEGHIFKRKLLMETRKNGSTIGTWLGWIMATIYMGGRLPQIILNIRRGSVEGLNPLMFLFAMFANSTYVGSILVRSIEWRRVKANAPWLLDAIVCVLLDLLIILQYGYYKLTARRRISNEEDSYNYYCIEPEKPQL